jgi:hypothetical protein
MQAIFSTSDIWQVWQSSRTLVSYSSLFDLGLPGESVSYQMQGESVGWWSNTILLPRKTGGGFRGARQVTSTSRQGPDTSSCGRLQVQGLDTSRRCRLTGARHLTSSPPIRVQCPLCGSLSASFYLRRFNPLFLFRRRGFFSFSIYRIRHAHTLTSPPGASGRNGSHEECTWPDEAELGLLRAHWIIGPPFVDLKSLATMSNAGGVDG